MSDGEKINRQIIRRSSQIMLEDLEKLQRREVDLGDVVRSFKYYARDLEARMPLEQDFTSRLFELWFALEATYAVALADEKTTLDADDIDRVDKAVSQTCELIKPLAIADSRDASETDGGVTP